MTDALAESELVRLRPGMLMYARRIASRFPQIDGEDILQAAYLHAWAHRERIRYADAMLMYVRRCVRNELVNVFRSQTWRHTLPMDAGEYAQDQTRCMERIEARLDVERLAALVQTPCYRRALRLRLSGCEPETAVSTYKVQLHRGIKAARAAA